MEICIINQEHNSLKAVLISEKANDKIQDPNWEKNNTNVSIACQIMDATLH